MARSVASGKRHVPGDVLGRRALNRALLARQFLLRRRRLSVASTIEHLVGMQAQVPDDPYVGLWARLDGFRPETLGRLIAERRAVRASLMRGTIHLVTARDCLALRPVMQPALERAFTAGSPFGRRVKGMNLEALTAAGRELVEREPRTLAELRSLLGARWPRRDPDSLAHAVGYLLPLVQIPPRGVWGARGRAILTTVESWLGRPLAAESSPDRAVVRYLAAFGPATAADIRTWSGLAGLSAVIERLRPRLVCFRDERGREIFDLPEAPRPDPETPAPPRFLPEYDNAFLSHADRARIVSDEDRRRLLAGRKPGSGTVLVDGFVAGTWRIARTPGTASLCVGILGRLQKKDRSALAEEGDRLLAFAAANETARRVRFASAD